MSVSIVSIILESVNFFNTCIASVAKISIHLIDIIDIQSLQ